MNPKVSLSEFVSGFLAESDDLLGTANTTLMAIETAARQGKGAPRAVRDAYRALHTIKGLSSMVGIEPVVSVSHQMEALLRRAEELLSVSGTRRDELLRAWRDSKGGEYTDTLAYVIPQLSESMQAKARRAFTQP